MAGCAMLPVERKTPTGMEEHQNQFDVAGRMPRRGCHGCRLPCHRDPVDWRLPTGAEEATDDGRLCHLGFLWLGRVVLRKKHRECVEEASKRVAGILTVGSNTKYKLQTNF